MLVVVGHKMEDDYDKLEKARLDELNAVHIFCSQLFVFTLIMIVIYSVTSA